MGALLVLCAAPPLLIDVVILAPLFLSFIVWVVDRKLFHKTYVKVITTQDVSVISSFLRQTANVK